MTPVGSFFPDDGGEKQYSGAIVFDHANPACCACLAGSPASGRSSAGKPPTME